MTFFKRRRPKVDTAALAQKAATSLEKTKGQQEHVNKLTAYLINRNSENGFGEDFDVTVVPRRT